MKTEAYDNLIKEFGKEKIDEMLDRLEEYADINPKRFKDYANHATVIRKWIREDKEKASKKPDNRTLEIGQWIRTGLIKESIEKAFKDKKINCGINYIEFIGIRDGYVKFDDPKAKTLIEHYLRKIGVLN
jgi:hypothetical protein